MSDGVCSGFGSELTRLVSVATQVSVKLIGGADQRLADAEHRLCQINACNRTDVERLAHVAELRVPSQSDIRHTLLNKFPRRFVAQRDKHSFETAVQLNPLLAELHPHLHVLEAGFEQFPEPARALHGVEH